MLIESDRPVECFFKRSLYVFPERSKIFVNAGKLSVEIEGKKYSNIKNYLREKESTDSNNKIGFPITGIGSDIYKKYQPAADYFEKNNKLDFADFERATVNDLPLCSFLKSYNSNVEKDFISDIYKALPHIINIFKKPVVHLTEIETIQPIDAVKRIGSKAVRHLSSHAETWGNIKKGTIIPKKLQTKTYDDDYGIYENLMFCDLIDGILLFLYKRICRLTEILDVYDSVKPDAFSKLMHSKYYLAIGKLFAVFLKTESSEEIFADLDETRELYNKISGYKTYKIYTKNTKRTRNERQLRQTNIFRMHKDYKHIFSLYERYMNQSSGSQSDGLYEKQVQSQNNYELFCSALTLFAAANFNFEASSGTTVFNAGNLNASLAFQKWILNLNTTHDAVLGLNAIRLNITYLKKTVRFLLIPLSYYIEEDKKKFYEHIMTKLYAAGGKYDKIVFLDPFDYEKNLPYNYSVSFSFSDTDLQYSVLPVSASEINSFRRIQRLILEGMVLCDEVGDTCAFCGGEMKEEPNGDRLCIKCRMAVAAYRCEGCKKIFKAAYPDVKVLKTDAEKSRHLPDFFKQEKQFLFRNTVNMFEGGLICPYCGCKNSKSKNMSEKTGEDSL